jgi:hypothetical protein
MLLSWLVLLVQGTGTGTLVMLLHKLLRPSDVSSLGRIVLPKVCIVLKIIWFGWYDHVWWDCKWFVLLLWQGISWKLKIVYNYPNSESYNFILIKQVPLPMLQYFSSGFNASHVNLQKEAESCLPYLAVKEGMLLTMEDFYTGKTWKVRYRYKGHYSHSETDSYRQAIIW